jgi:hypothetical protein
VSYWLRQALLIALGGVLLLGIVVVLARRQTMTLRYTLGWTLIAFAGILGALLTPLVEPVSDLFGMSPTGLLLAGASLVLLAITLLLSVSVSGLQTQLREVTEAHALLARRVEEIGELDDAVTDQ